MTIGRTKIPANQIEREARVVGLRDVDTLSLEAVERRRLQLWALTVVLLLVVSIGVAILSTWRGPEVSAVLSPPVLRIAIVLLSIAFGVYAIEKELHLHRLTRMLTEERVLTTALTNRLHELSLLLDAGKAMNSVLELPAVLETILRSAMELLGAGSGSIMLLEEDELVVVISRGNDPATGNRVRVGSGIAGRVAQTREALLVNGRADPSEFPGVAAREQDVRSALSVPLVHRDDLFGVLNVNAKHERRYNEYDLRALSLFAEQAAGAIANARMYETEREHVEQLLELDRMRNEISALVTHELRAPITTILGAAQGLQSPGLEEHTPEFVDMVDRQARRLQAMVDELLTATRIEKDRELLRLQPVDLAGLVREAVADAAVADREIAVTAPTSVLISAEPDAVRRIVDNLIDNAYKYGAPPVRVVIEEADGEIVLSVLDAGRGIPEADRVRVFDRFLRLDRDRAHPGLGLGLGIVQSLAEACGGRVWVDDAPGGGAAFRVAFQAVLTPAGRASTG